MSHLTEYATSQRTGTFVLGQTTIEDVKLTLEQPGQAYTLEPRAAPGEALETGRLVSLVKDMVL